VGTIQTPVQTALFSTPKLSPRAPITKVTEFEEPYTSMTGKTRFIQIGAVFGAIGVAAGAFGAHYLESLVGGDGMGTFETAVRYHLTHALVLVLAGVMRSNGGSAKWLDRAGWLLVVGLLLFSGSLYVLVLAGIPILGAVAPIGGLALIGGWVCLGLGAAQTETHG